MKKKTFHITQKYMIKPMSLNSVSPTASGRCQNAGHVCIMVTTL